MNARAYALSDGNSFYCLCERVFDAQLAKVPVIVLSNIHGPLPIQTRRSTLPEWLAKTDSPLKAEKT